MRFGLITPVLTLSRIHNEWEESASVEDAATIVRGADRLGYHHVTAAEHVAVPVDVAAERGGRYWDPLVTLSYFAAITRRVTLVTHTIVIGFHHPLAVLKHYSSLDRISGGRLVLGIGVGSLREEFEVLDAPFDDRGPRADDTIAAIRNNFGRRVPSHDGAYYRFDGFVVEPVSIQQPVPLWIGGRTGRSLRRAVNLGDGWAPFRLTEPELAALLDRARDTDAWSQRRVPLDVVLVPEPALNPLDEPQQTLDAVERQRELGATVLNLYLRHNSLQHCIEQMEAFVAVTGAQMHGHALEV